MAMSTIDLWHEAGLASIFGLHVYAEDEFLYACGWGSHRIVKIDSATMTLVVNYEPHTGGLYSSLAFGDAFLYAGDTGLPATVWKHDLSSLAEAGHWQGHSLFSAMVHGVAYDGAYLYACYSYLHEPRVVKILPGTMAEISTWRGPDIGATLPQTRDLILGGGYLFVSLVTPASVRKLNPATMTQVGSAWGAEAQKLFYFDGYLYAGRRTSPAKVYKIDPLTMTTVAIWTAPSGMNSARGLTALGDFLYATLDTLPARIYAIDPSTMTTVDPWIGPIAVDCGNSLACDENYIYITFIASGPSEVYKIGPVPPLAYLITACRDSSYAYFAANMDPGRVAKIDLDAFSHVDTLIFDEGDSYPQSCALKSGNALFGLFKDPGRIVQVELAGFTEAAKQDFVAGEAYFRGGAPNTKGSFCCRLTPGKLVNIDCSDLTYSTLNLQTGDDNPVPVVVDADANYAFLGLWTSPGKVVVIKLPNTRESRFSLPEDFSLISCGAADTSERYLYVGAFMDPGKIARIKYGLHYLGIPYWEYFYSKGTAYGLQPELLAAQVRFESNFDPDAVGDGGLSRGLAQISEAAWDEVMAPISWDEAFDPELNIEAQCKYLNKYKSWLQTNYGITQEKWLLALYNWGVGNIQSLLDAGGSWDDVPSVVRTYAQNILDLAQEYKASPP